MAIYEVVLKQTIQGEEVVNVFHVEAADGVHAEIADDFATNIVPLLAAAQNYQLEHTGIYVRVAQKGQVGIEFVPSNYPIQGEYGFDTMPRFVSAVVYGLANATTKPHRARKSIAGVPESQHQSGVISDELYGKLEAFAAAWVDPASYPQSGAVPVVYSATTGNYNPLASYQVKRELGTQNSRKR
jgi:hypothetical protein